MCGEGRHIKPEKFPVIESPLFHLAMNVSSQRRVYREKFCKSIFFFFAVSEHSYIDQSPNCSLTSLLHKIFFSVKLLAECNSKSFNIIKTSSRCLRTRELGVTTVYLIYSTNRKDMNKKGIKYTDASDVLPQCEIALGESCSTVGLFLLTCVHRDYWIVLN